MRNRHFRLVAALALASVAALSAVALARTASEIYPASGPWPIELAHSRAAGSRDHEFYGWWHDAGELLLHKSNYGFLGDWNAAPGEPSAEWPAGSSYEHLYCAGLWVGARVGSDSLVSAGAYGMEFLAPADDPVYTIYESASGAPGGEPDFDDDSDGLTDEDRLDGIDNDLDGLVDEDYAAISDEMFACVYFDTTEIDNAPPEDIHVPLGLEVYETSYAWSHDRFDDFVRIRYEITNIGQNLLDEVYLGILADPDVGHGADASNNFMDDRAAYLDKETPEIPVQERTRLQMAYCWDEPAGQDGTWGGYVGFLVLDHPTDPDGIVAPQSVGPLVYRSWYAGPDFPRSDPARYRFMSEPLISPPAADPQDWRFVLSVGPFDELAPGETTFLEIAVVCGQGLRGLVENACSLHSRLEHASALEPLRGPPMAAAGVESENEPVRFRLAPPAPNPASASTGIAFTVPRRERVELSVLNCAGRVVATLVDGERVPGEHAALWDGRTGSGTPASSGVYLLRLRTESQEAFRKLVLIR